MSQFTEVLSQLKTVEPSSSDIDLVISHAQSETNEADDEAENRQALGLYMATWIRSQVEATLADGKIPVLDLATGNTPKYVWPFLAEMVAAGTFDINRIVITGHEVVYGEPETDMDYEGYRRTVAEKTFGLTIDDIAELSQVTGSEIQGNFLPMHLVQVSREEFASENAFLEAEQAAAKTAATHYDTLLHALAARSDVRIISLYGVGKDGHIAEIQPNTLTGAVDYDTDHTYVYSPRLNSKAAGTFPWTGDEHEYHNDMYTPQPDDAELDDKGYKGARQLMGWGWQDLLLPEKLMIAFDSKSKSYAFQLTMEGSVDGVIMQDGQEVMKVEAQRGEGETLVGELLEYARGLDAAGFFTAANSEWLTTQSENLTCKQLFHLIHAELLNRKAQTEDQNFTEIFIKMWDFANRYLGKQAPVAVLVRLRSLLGLDTTIVAVPEVVKDTKYSALAG